MQVPATRRVDHVDTYHGVRVADPYRWLEDDNAEETKAWVEAQNRATFAHLATIPFRPALAGRLEALFDYPKHGLPVRRGSTYFFARNDGLQNQAVWYRQQGLHGEPELLLDPNAFSPDGTTKLSVFSVSGDGSLVLYGLSQGGSDWQEYRVLDVATKRTLDDRVERVKVSGAAWAGRGFFYSTYPMPEPGRELSTKNLNHRVFYHRLGTGQAEDELVFEDPAHPERFHTLEVTEDERYAVLTISDRGQGLKGNALFFRDLPSGEPAFRPIVGDIGDDSFHLEIGRAHV